MHTSLFRSVLDVYLGFGDDAHPKHRLHVEAHDVTGAHVGPSHLRHLQHHHADDVGADGPALHSKEQEPLPGPSPVLRAVLRAQAVLLEPALGELLQAALDLPSQSCPVSYWLLACCYCS